MGRGLWRLSGPSPLLKAGPTTVGCSGPRQDSFEYLQGWKLHKLSGRPAPVFEHRGKKILLIFKWNFLDMSLHALPLVLSLRDTEKSLALSSLHPPFRYL